MSWTDIEERITPKVNYDASVRLYQRGADSRPTLIISLRKSITADLKWKPADLFGLALGKDDNAGKVRIIRRKVKTIAKPRQMKTGALSFDFGYVPQLGERGTLKADAVAVMIDADTVEVTIPQFDYEDEIEEEEESPEPEPPRSAPAAAPMLHAAAPMNAGTPSAPNAPRKGPLKYNGVMIDDGKDAERITFKGKSMEITLRQAIFLQALAKVMPQPVDRNFIATKIFGVRHPATAGIVIDQITMDLGKALPGIGLQIKNIKGVGFALHEAS